jgi:formate-dependent nitrite reductase membrane component NrfD
MDQTTTTRQRSPYGRHVETRPVGRPPALKTEAGPLAPYQGETYYGLPAVKASHYGWLIATYFFVGGLSGSAQLLAAVADLKGRGRRRALVRAGRYLALAGSVVSPVLLIADLHTPQRWYNMLRIFRKTSPMSIGSWTLAAFGTASGLTAVAQLLEDVTGSAWGRRLARLFGLPAAAAGALMSVYTGTLLASTSTPLWASAPRLLPALFGASAASTAAAALSLTLRAAGASEEEQEGVERFSAVAGTAELALAAAARENWRGQGLDGPLRGGPASAALAGAVGLGVVVPLVIHGVQALTGRRSRTASTVAAVSALAGGFLLRAAVLFAGNRSARRPADYFHFTRPAGVEREGDGP